MKSIRPILAQLMFLAAMMASVQPCAASEIRELTILHTSDLHGNVIPDAEGRKMPGSLARVSVEVAKIRKDAGHPVLLLDSGDTLQGTPLEEFVDVRWGENSPTIEVMNRLGYEAMAIGNHDFNYGLGVLRRAEKQAHFPFLAANALLKTTHQPAFPAFKIIELEELKVGILGLVTPNIPGWEDPVNYEGLYFEAMDESARKWVSRLRDQQHCDLIIVLAHTGFEIDPFSGKDEGSEVENYAERLSRIPGIDLLLTGHVHQDIPPMLHHGVIVSEPLAHARRLTRIDLKLGMEAGHWKIEDFKGENIKLDDSPVDQRIIEEMADRRDRVMRALAKPLTRSAAEVSVHFCREEDCAALDLIHQVQLKASGAEISMASLLGDQTPDLQAGPLTRSWVDALYTYPNTLRMVSVSGAELLDIMEYAARYYAGLNCPGQGPCRLTANPEVRHYNVDSFEGVSYRIDPTAPEGQRIWDLRYQGKPIDLHQNFTLVCNNYRVAGGGGFPHLKTKKILWRSSHLMADLIDEYLSSQKLWEAGCDSNWAVAPRLGASRLRVPAKEPKNAP